MELDYSLRGLLAALFRQQRKMIVIGAAIMALGLFYLLSMPVVYESRGSMLVKFGQDARPSLSVAGGNRTTEVSSSDRAEIIQSNISIIYSSDLLRSAVVEFGVERLYPGITESTTNDTPEGAAIGRLQRGDLMAQSGGRNNIIEIGVRNKDPEVSAAFARMVMEHFTRRQAEIYNKPQTDFLQQQITDAAKKLEESQLALQAFKQETGISDLDEEMSLLMRQKTDLTGIAYQAVTQAQAELAKLEAEAAEMRATYRANSPAMRRMGSTVSAARQTLNQRQADVNTTGEAGTALSAQLRQIGERLAFLERNRAAYSDLEQRVTIDQENYKYYQQRGEEARANDVLNQQNITRISVIDTPSVPMQPASRNRKLLFVAIMMTAALAALAAAVLFELLDDRLRTPQQLGSRLRVPVMATFSVKGA